MKKLITIAAVAALGVGAATAASANTQMRQLNQRFNQLNESRDGVAWTAKNCRIWSEMASTLNSALNAGDYFVGSTGKDDFGKFHDDSVQRMKHNMLGCKRRGFPTPPIVKAQTTAAQISASERSRTAPVAQNQSSRAVPAQGMTLKQMADYQTQRTIRNCGYPNDSRAYQQCKDQSSNMGFAEMFLGF